MVLFIRKAKEILILWRVSSTGQIRTTVANTKTVLEVRSNATHAADYEALLDFFCDRIEAKAKEDAENELKGKETK